MQYPGTGDILINSSPQGAYIYIDGNSIIDTQGHAILTPVRVTGVRRGLHEIQISLDRYYSKKIFLNVIAEKINEISVVLQSVLQAI